MKSISEVIVECRVMMEDHDPEGWPEIQMNTITALCDEIERLTPKFIIGDKVGAYLFSGTSTGEVIGRIEEKNIGISYWIFLDSPHSGPHKIKENFLFKLQEG